MFKKKRGRKEKEVRTRNKVPRYIVPKQKAKTSRQKEQQAVWNGELWSPIFLQETNNEN